MLQTVEAIYDPKQGLAFKEAVNVTGPVKVLVTFVEPSYPASPAKGSASALMAALEANQLPNSAKLSDAEIDAQIRELAENCPQRRFGAMKDQARVGDAFFESLPDDELDTWAQ
jgi:hypothetical protein